MNNLLDLKVYWNFPRIEG